MSNSVELAIPEDERALRGLELVEAHFPQERREQIAQFLDVPADSPALVPYLAWCAGQKLSPIAGHVWLIPKKIKARDGNPERTIYRPAIGRDGLLHIAHESRGKPHGFRGLRSNVVCEHDSFEVEDDGNDVKILHRFASKPTEFAAGVAPDRYRGRVIGAWAKCMIDGEPPTFYYANLREHGRLRQVWDYNPGARKRQPLFYDGAGRYTFAEIDGEGRAHKPVQEWDGAWDYTSTMCLKAAQSYVLRIALNVTGVIPMDELREPMGEDAPRAPGVVGDAEPAGFDFEKVAESVRDRLRDAVNAANEMEPYAWAPAKCEMVFSNRRDEELEAIAEQIERENETRAQRYAAEAKAAEEIVDAEVVPDGGDPPDEPARARATDRKMELEEERVELMAKIERAPDADELASLQARLDQVNAELSSL